MITLTKLNWSNCFSYGENNELDLSSETVTQIIGTNGMGKSSIPLIIEEALYNKNSKGIKKADIPNRYINKGYNIHLCFTKDDDSYEVIIDRKSNIKVQLIKNGEDISSHTATNTYKTIQEVIGIDFKTFTQLVYQNTNTSLQFLTATDTNRKKFLIDLLHLENYVKLFELFKEAAKKSTSNLTAIESKIATIEKWLNDNKLSDTSVLPMLEVSIDTEDDEKELRHLTIELENISEKNKKIQQNNRYKDLLNAIDLKEIEGIDVVSKQSYDDLQSRIGSLNGVIAGSQKLITKLQGLGDHCPTCEQSVDASFKQGLLAAEIAKKDTAQEEQNELEGRIEEIKRNNRLFDIRERRQKEWEDLYRSIDHSLQTSLLDKHQLEGRISDISSRIRAAKSEVSKIAAENEKRTKHNTRIQVILEQTDGFKAQLEEAGCTVELK